MSTSIDSKVVEMKFDNKDFEANVKNSLSTLDKLKEKLNFKGASSGLESIQNASDKISFNGAINGAENLSVKFSALQVAGMTAISNITNSLMSLTSGLINTFAVQPKTDGFAEYELQMGSIQTIMASTGESVDTVNKYLDELNTYADQTIYSFSDMTQNIGKFTNAGVSLDKAVAAIKGISNEAAVSGANTNEASRAMYNFAQALSAGYVKLIDWKSIENANMATVEFKQQLLDSAVAAGTLEKQADGMYKVLSSNGSGSTMDECISATHNFNESLEYQWMTTDALVNTLNDYADASTAIGDKATKAATEVKTFSMMMDTLKESAGSGWTKTWQLIFGDFEEAKEMWTNLTNTFDGIIQTISNARNNLLSGIMDNTSWDSFSSRITDTGIALDDFQNKLIEVANSRGIDMNALISQYGSFANALGHCDDKAGLVADTLIAMADSTSVAEKSQEDLNAKLNYFQDVVDRVWYGDFKNGQERIQLLTEAGYDYAKVQDLVNKTVDGHRLTLEDLGDEQLQAIGYTQEEIDKLRALSDEAKKTGSSLNDLINSLGQRSGRDLIFNSSDGIVFNLVNSIKQMGSIVQKAFSKLFEPIKASSVVNALSKIREATQSLLNFLTTKEDALSRTFAGLIAPLKILTSILSGVFRSALKAISKILGNVDTDIFDVTASVGDAVVAFTNWFTSSKVLGKVFEAIDEVLDTVITHVKNTTTAIKNFAATSKTIQGLSKAFEAIKNAIVGLVDPATTTEKRFSKIKEAAESASTAFEYGQSKIGAAIDTMVEGHPILEKFVDILKTLIENFEKFIEQLNILENIKNIFDNASDAAGGFSDVLFGTGDATSGKRTVKDVIDDIWEYAQQYISQLPPISLTSILDSTLAALEDFKVRFIDTMSGMFSDTDKAKESITGFFEGIDWGKILQVSGPLAAVVVIKKLADAFQSFNKVLAAFSPMNALQPAITAISGFFTGLKNAMGGVKFAAYATGILEIAVAVGIMAVAIRMIGAMDYGKMAAATTAIIGVILAFGVLAALTAKLGTPENAAAFAGLAALVASLIVAMLALAGAVKIIGAMDPASAAQGLAVVAVMLILLGAIIVLTVSLAKSGNAGSILAVGVLCTQLGVTLLLMSAAIGILGAMNQNALIQGTVTVLALITFMTIMTLMLSVCGEGKLASVAAVLLAFGVTINLLVTAIALVGMMDEGSLSKGIVVIGVFATFLTAMIWVISTHSVALVGVAAAMLGISISIGILIGVAELAGKLSREEFAKGAAAIAVFGSLLTAMIVVISRCGGGQVVKCAAAIAAVSIGLAALMVVAILCGMVDTEQLAKGVTAVSIMGLIMAAMLKACGGIQQGALDKAAPAIISMAAVIGVMTVCAILLGMMDPEKCAQGVLAVSTLGSVFALIIYAAGQAEKGITAKTLSTMAIIAAVMVAISALLYAMSEANVKDALPNAEALSLVLLAITAAVAVLSGVGDVSNAALKSCGILLGVVAGIAVILGLMSYCGVEASYNNAIALSGVLLALVFAVKILETVKDVAPSAIEAVGTLTGVLVVIAVILGLMAGLNVEASLGNAAALGLLLNALAFAVLILSHSKENYEPAYGAVITMTLVLAAIAGIFIWLSSCNAEASLPTALALGTVLNALAISVVILSAANGVAGSALLAAGIMTALAYALAGTLVAINSMDPVSAIPTAAALGTLLISLSAAVVILSYFNAGGLAAAMAGTLVLSALIIELAAVVHILSKFDKGAIKTGCAALNTLATGLGEAIGNFIGGAFEAAASHLPSIGQSISLFAMTLQPAIATFKSLGGMDFSGVSGLAGAIMDLTGAGLMNQLATFGGTFQSNWGDLFCQFASCIKSFCNEIKDVKPKQLAVGVEAAKMMSKLANAMPTEGGVFSFFTGSKTEGMENLASSLKAFGTATKSFAKSVDGVDLGVIDTGVQAVKKMAKLMSIDWPSEGGFLDQLIGKKSNGMNAISKGLPALGTAAKDFGKNTSGIDGSGIDTAISVIKKVSKLLTTEGIDAKLSLDVTGIKVTFGKLGNAAAEFAKNTAGNDYGSVEAAVSALKSIAAFIKNNLGKGISADNADAFVKSVNSLGNARVADLVAAFQNGTEDLRLSGLNLMEALAQGITNGREPIMAAATNIISTATGYFSSLSTQFQTPGLDMMVGLEAGINMGTTGVTTAISTSVSTIKQSIATLNTDFTFAGTTLMANLCAGITSGAGGCFTAIATACTSMTTSITSQGGTFSTSGVSLMTRLAGGISNSVGSVIGAVTTVLSSARSTIGEKKESFRNGGEALVNALKNGIRTGHDKVTNAISYVLSGATGAIRSQRAGFRDAGKYCAAGLAEGIRNGQSACTQAARNIAKAAVRAAKNEAGVASPSKKFIEIGKWCVVGFANGFDKYNSLASDAGSTLAQTVMSATSDSLDMLSMLNDSKVSFGTANLTPVIDSSNIRSYSGTLDLSAQLTRAIVEPVKSNAAVLAETQQAIDASNQRVIEALNGLNSDFQNYTDGISNMEVSMYLDGKQMASSLAKPMNQALGKFTKRGL